MSALRARSQRAGKRGGVRPSYAMIMGLTQQARCRNCNLWRYIVIEGPWEKLASTDESQRVQCGWCGTAFRRFRT